jgi:cytochrome P450
VAPGRPLTLGDLPSLPYLTAVIKETMRLYPPAWIIGRRALRRDQIGDTEIPPDSVVAISPYVLHRHPRYWPEPETFDPRRFMDENGERTRTPYSYIPFGAGPRSCIGANFALAEAPLIVGLLMQRYAMSLPDDTHVRPYGIFVLTPRPPIRTFLSSIDRN